MSNHVSSNVSKENSPTNALHKKTELSPLKLAQKLEEYKRAKKSGASSPLRNHALNPNFKPKTDSAGPKSEFSQREIPNLPKTPALTTPNLPPTPSSISRENPNKMYKIMTMREELKAKKNKDLLSKPIKHNMSNFNKTSKSELGRLLSPRDANKSEGIQSTESNFILQNYKYPFVESKRRRTEKGKTAREQVPKLKIRPGRLKCSLYS